MDKHSSIFCESTSEEVKSFLQDWKLFVYIDAPTKKQDCFSLEHFLAIIIFENKERSLVVDRGAITYKKLSFKF
jgi:hypothetical protein